MKKSRVLMAALAAVMVAGCQQTPSSEEVAAVAPLQAQALIGSQWSLLELNGQAIAEPVSVSMMFQPSEQADFNLRIGGIAACNNYNGVIALDETTGKFAADKRGFATTMKLCAEPELNQMESRFLQSLQQNQRLQQLAADRLLMEDISGNRYLFGRSN